MSSSIIPTTQFIEKARFVHGQRYDYSRVVYRNSHTSIIIGCSQHGWFTQRPSDHLAGCGCRQCGRESTVAAKRLTTAEFVQRAREVHGDKYDYSKVKYDNNKAKVVIGCPIHGWFEQIAAEHLKSGCRACAYIAVREKLLMRGSSEFVARATAVHGDRYDYSQVDYQGANRKVAIGCPVHGPFEQLANDHLRGCGCQLCGNEKIRLCRLSSTDQFVIQARSIHGDKYDYSEVCYKGNKKRVTIICPTHGPFNQRPNDHLAGKNGCPHCNESQGERRVVEVLGELGIEHKRQVRFPDLTRNGKRLAYDFGFSYRGQYFLVEYDGEQHSRPIDAWGGEKEFAAIQRRDKAKDRYAAKNGYVLIRIPYTDLGRIEEILKEALRG